MKNEQNRSNGSLDIDEKGYFCAQNAAILEKPEFSGNGR